MYTPQRPEVRYVPHQETRAPSSDAASIWLILAMGVLVPGVLSYVLSTSGYLTSVAIVVGLLGLSAILIQPYIGMVIFLALVYIRPEELYPEITGMRLTLMVASATLAGTWLQLFLKREKVIQTPLYWFIIAFGVFAPAVTMGRGEVGEAIRELWMNVIIVLMFLNLVRKPKQYDFVVTLFIALTTYLAVYSIYLLSLGQAYLDKQLHLERIMSDGSIFNDPNDLASALVVGMALCAMRVVNGRNWFIKGIYAILGLICVYSLLLTGSRGGMVSLLVVIMGVFIFFSRKPIIAVVLALLCASAFVKLGPSRMTDFDTTEYSAAHRLKFWNSGLEELQAHPFYGAGYGRFKDINNGRPPHNSFVQVFGELGYPGYFCWMGMIYYAFRKRPASSAGYVPTLVQTRELIGGRLALAGLLAASFWLSRAYIPNLYVVCLLPIMQQVTASGNVNIVKTNSKDFFKDVLYINAWCIISIAVIWFMVNRYG